MAPRVVLVRDESEPLSGSNVVSLRWFATEQEAADLVASVVVHAEANLERLEAEVEAAVAGLLPFADGQLERIPVATPRWDDDALLADPARGASWPQSTELRLGTRQAIYSLDRAAVAGLGTDGDLLLGWRAGDAIAAEIG